MAEYINKEEILKFPIRIHHCDREHGSAHFVYGIECVMEYIENIPPADVVEVVRCKDCQHYNKRYHRCNLHSEEPDQYSTGFIFEMQEDDFCSCGERRDNETN